MASASFGKRLLNEIQRGGKKSIVLGLLLLVGLSIWSPMIWRAVLSKRGASTSADAKLTTTKTQSTNPQAVPAPAATANIEWKSLHQRLEKSALIQPTSLDELVRDPFEQAWIQDRKAATEVKKEPDEKGDKDPVRSLVLSAILAGGESSAAVINDVVYKIGQEVPRKGPVRFVLREIRPDRVLLERAGTIEELQLRDGESSIRESADPER